MMQDQILETLQSLKHEVHKRYKAEPKGIFGSYTRGEAREDSDIDILVEFREGATLLDLTVGNAGRGECVGMRGNAGRWECGTFINI